MRRFFGGLAMLLALAPALTTTAYSAVPSPEGAIPPANQADYDTFDLVTVNQVVNGVEQPITTGVNVTTPTFDTSTFGVQPFESDVHNPPVTSNRNGCGGTPPSYAGRTAWLRFNPGVAGILVVKAITTYDAVLMVRGATERPLGQTSLTDLDGHPQGCINAVPGPGAETVPSQPTTCTTPFCYKILPELTYFIQVGGLCPEIAPGQTSPTTCGSALGGPTQIQVSFVPDDTDGDTVPDSTDACPTVAGNASAQGCPDADGDGVRNDNGADNCPTQAGVPAPAPYNGCPAGPTPPKPTTDILVQALDGNVDNTNSISVKLALSWPQGAQRMTISNGDGILSTYDVAASQDWQLRPLAGSSPSESRQVSVTFQGPGIPDTYRTDSITLDTRAPSLPKQRLYQNGDGWLLAVKAEDGGTGVSRITTLTKTGKTIDDSKVCSKTKCPSVTRRLFTTDHVRPRLARLTDAAGNSKVVRLVRRSTTCDPVPNEYLVLKGGAGAYDCFVEGQSCRKDEGYRWSLSPYVRCKVAEDNLRRVKVIARPLVVAHGAGGLADATIRG